ncbi:MAG: thioredoxin family protein [Patescibacteria group bacterium]|nr:thioredoxin family protein [Patescibacteria group bacterium]
MNGEQTKKKFWEVVSPKTTFIFGIITGIALFATLSLVYSYTVMNKMRADMALENKATGALSETPNQPTPQEPSGTPVGSFIDTGKPVCKKDGKPIVRLFTTSWCPHCQWIKETFDKVAKEYVQKKKIIAYHWQLDKGQEDDTLTPQKEGSVPETEMNVFQEFNPYGSIPTFVFGCRYYRIGNAYEREGAAGLPKEEKEFRDLIEKLLKG